MTAAKESIASAFEAPSAALPLAAAAPVAENSRPGFATKKINSHPGWSEVNFKTVTGIQVSLRPEGIGSRCQSLNRYAYALNNPTTLIDPSGLDSSNPSDTCGELGFAESHAECGGPPPTTFCPPESGQCFIIPGIIFGGGGGAAGGGGSAGVGGTTIGGGGAGTTAGGHIPTGTVLSNPWQTWGPFGSGLPCGFVPCVQIADPFTAQLGLSIGWTLPWGVNFNVFAGLGIDLHGHFALYHGYGGGGAVGARASGGVQVGYSNANTVCGLAGPFGNASGTLGAEGAAGTVDVFHGSGDGPGGHVTGGGVTVGVGAGGSASLGVTTTTVVPVGKYRCP